MEKMEVDDVVDLSMATTPSSGISQATARDLQALTQTSGLTITRALPPPTPMNASVQDGIPPATGAVTTGATGGNSAAVAATPAISDNGAGPMAGPTQDNGEWGKALIVF